MLPGSPSLLHNRTHPPVPADAPETVPAEMADPNAAEAQQDTAQELEAKLQDFPNEDDQLPIMKAANLMFKLANLVGEPYLDRHKSYRFNMVVYQHMFGNKYVTGDDCRIVREFIDDVISQAKHALEGHFMTFPMMDLLRSISSMECPEYICGRNADPTSHFTNAAQTMGDFYTKHEECYAMANKVREVLLEGVKTLKEKREDCNGSLFDIGDYLDLAMCGPAFASMFDGRRLYAGLSICTNKVLRSCIADSPRAEIDHLLSASVSNASLNRVKVAVCLFYAMVRTSVKQQSNGLDAFSNDVMIRDLEQLFAEIQTVFDGLRRPQGAKLETASSMMSEVFKTISCWMQNAISWGENSFASQIVTWATVHALVLNKSFRGSSQKTREGVLVRLFNETTKTRQRKSVSVFEAANILCRLRFYGKNCADASDNGNMSLATAVLAVLSGLVGSFQSKDIRGPFVLDGDAMHEFYNAFNNLLPKVSYNLTATAGSGSKDANRNGNNCGPTEITVGIQRSGFVRGDHSKTPVVSGRLEACLTVLSIKESILRDIPQKLEYTKNVSADMTEGIKEIRCLHVNAMRYYPNIMIFERLKVFCCFVERSNGTENAEAKGSNVEKPWRDICGGVICSTILRPIAARGFLEAVVPVNQEEVKTTDKCVQVFCDELKKAADLVFDERNMQSTCMFYKEAETVLKFQKKLTHKYCTMIDNNGMIWEQLQNTFSINKNALMGSNKRQKRG